MNGLRLTGRGGVQTPNAHVSVRLMTYSLGSIVDAISSQLPPWEWFVHELISIPVVQTNERWNHNMPRRQIVKLVTLQTQVRTPEVL